MVSKAFLVFFGLCFFFFFFFFLVLVLRHVRTRLGRVCSHHNRAENTVFATEHLRVEQAPHLYGAMPDLSILPFAQAKNTAFAMENLRGEQALHYSEAMLKPCMLPFGQVKKQRVCNGEPER